MKFTRQEFLLLVYGSVWILFILLKIENNKKIIKKLLFTYLALFISLKSLFMDNEQCQTHVQGEKKHTHTHKTQHKKGNTQMPHIYIYIFFNLQINGFKKINCLIKNFIVYLLKCEIKLDIFLFFSFFEGR